ncbi:MAG: hypothetical protein KUG79_08740 [Pseudomonadales bacterium]|nr:hypothetical protein [Pseudomonadales bacterium]
MTNGDINDPEWASYMYCLNLEDEHHDAMIERFEDEKDGKMRLWSQ